MNRFKHCVFFADIRATRRADAALKFGGFVGNDVAIEVRQEKNLKIATAFFINELCRHNIGIPFVRCDFRIKLRNLVAVLKEVSVRSLYNVCLCDKRNARKAVFAGVIIGETGNSVRALLCRYRKIDGEIVRDVIAERADSIAALGIFSENRPVDALFGDFYGADIRKKVERLAHCNVCRLYIRHSAALLRSCCRTFEDNIALFQLRENVVRNALADLYSVFKRQPFNVYEFDLAACFQVGKDIFKHPFRLCGDNRADAVAAANADFDCFEL